MGLLVLALLFAGPNCYPPASAAACAQLANIWGWEGASWLCVSSAARDATSAADQRVRQEHAPEASVLHPPT